MTTFDELNLEAEIRLAAEKHDKPYSYCSQLLRQEIREGTSVPEAVEWLDRFLSKQEIIVR